MPLSYHNRNIHQVRSTHHKVEQVEEYHSHNTTRLDVEDMKEMLHRLNFIREDLGLQARVKTKEIRSE